MADLLREALETIMDSAGECARIAEDKGERRAWLSIVAIARNALDKDRASPQAGSVPDGFVLVPTKMTTEMQRAGMAHVLRLNEEENDPGSDEHYRAAGCLYAVWMDMLAAAPAPQRTEGES